MDFTIFVFNAIMLVLSGMTFWKECNGPIKRLEYTSCDDEKNCYLAVLDIFERQTENEILEGLMRKLECTSLRSGEDTFEDYTMKFYGGLFKDRERVTRLKENRNTKANDSLLGDGDACCVTCVYVH